MNDTYTDCRSEEGVTVGLIDAIISISRILAERIRNFPMERSVEDAMCDLLADEDMSFVMQWKRPATRR